MFQVAAAVGGGIFLQQAISGVQLPKLKQAGDAGPVFTLSIQVVAASVPGLSAPGLLSQQRPYLAGSLGASTKETEFADFAKAGGDRAGPYAKECPWRFGDTLTFKARLEDLIGPGLKLSLRVRKDILLGPVQFEMRAASIGEAALDLRSRVLPSCVEERHDALRGFGQWSSPVMLIPLSHVPEGICNADCRLGEAIAHVALIFSVDADPEPILRPNSLTQRLEERMEGAFRWLVEGAISGRVGQHEEAIAHFGQPCADVPGALKPPPWNTSIESESACAGGATGLELTPEGWISFQAPNGRTFWHHRALGPAPWEQSLDDAGWISHQSSTGRVFWHHRALGPAPWELQQPQDTSAGGRTLLQQPSAEQIAKVAPSGHAPQCTPIQRLPRSSALSEADAFEYRSLADLTLQ